MNTCEICGNTFEPYRSAPNQHTCGESCYRVRHNNLMREHMRKKREAIRLLNGTIRTHERRQLADTTIIEVNGQPRVRAAVILEKLILKRDTTSKRDNEK